MSSEQERSDPLFWGGFFESVDGGEHIELPVVSVLEPVEPEGFDAREHGILHGAPAEVKRLLNLGEGVVKSGGLLLKSEERSGEVLNVEPLIMPEFELEEQKSDFFLQRGGEVL